MQKDIIKKIIVGLLIMPICSVLAIMLWEYRKQFYYINYENTNKIGLSILISTVVVEVIYIYWCIKSSENEMVPIKFIMFSIASAIVIMIGINYRVLHDVKRAIGIEFIFMTVALGLTYGIANNL